MMVEGSVVDIDDLPDSLHGPFSDDSSKNETLLSLEELQRRHILRVLQVVGGSKPRAAEILGIGRATLYQILSRMKEEKEANEAA
jgi:DNA-binding NtrC family response regulator